MPAEDKVYTPGETFSQWVNLYNELAVDELKGLGYNGNANKYVKVNSAGDSHEYVELIKKIEIGPWDMSNTGTVNIPHGLGAGAIGALVKVSIINDLQTFSSPLSVRDGLIVDPQPAGFHSVDDTNIDLTRIDDGFYELSGFYDSDAINRGFIWIIY